MGTMNMSPERVVSVWEPDEGELALLKAMLDSHANGGPRPRVSLMSHVYGQPLQPIRMTVGEFSDPYRVPGPPDPPKNRYRPVG